MKKRIILAGTAVAAAVALTACGEPSGQTSPSGTNYTVTFDKQFQNERGLPLVRAACVGQGENFWRYSAEVNVNSYEAATVSVSAYCPTGVLVGSWTSRAS